MNLHKRVGGCKLLVNKFRSFCDAIIILSGALRNKKYFSFMPISIFESSEHISGSISAK